MPKLVSFEERQQKQHAILDAAAAEIATYGYDRANINVIAERAGIGRGTIYLYFASKEEVLNALLATIGELIDSTVRDCLASSDTWDRKIELLAAAFVKLAHKHRDFFRVHISALHGVNRAIGAPVTDWLRKTTESLRVALDTAVLHGNIVSADTEVLAIYLLGSLESFALLPELLGVDSERITQQSHAIAHLLWVGLAATHCSNSVVK